jgi:hypothetical protein
MVIVAAVDWILLRVNAPADAELLMAVTAGALTKSRTDEPVVLETFTNSMLVSNVGITEIPFNSILIESVPSPPLSWSSELRVGKDPETEALYVSSPLAPVKAVPVSIPVVSELIDIGLALLWINDLADYFISQRHSTYQFQTHDQIKLSFYQWFGGVLTGLSAYQRPT